MTVAFSVGQRSYSPPSLCPWDIGSQSPCACANAPEEDSIRLAAPAAATQAVRVLMKAERTPPRIPLPTCWRPGYSSDHGQATAALGEGTDGSAHRGGNAGHGR